MGPCNPLARGARDTYTRFLCSRAPWQQTVSTLTKRSYQPLAASWYDTDNMLRGGDPAERVAHHDANRDFELEGSMYLAPKTRRSIPSSDRPLVVVPGCGRTNATTVLLATVALVSGCAQGSSSENRDRSPGTASTDAGETAPTHEPDASTEPGSPPTAPEGDTEPQPPHAECPPGRYEGVFECDMVPTGWGGLSEPFNVSGPIILHFEKGEGEFLQVVDGKLEAAAATFFGMRAGLNGTLQCGSGELELTTKNGLWALGDPAMPLLPGGTFETKLTGSLRESGSVPTIGGTWALDEPMIGRCEGTWSVSQAP